MRLLIVVAVGLLAVIGQTTSADDGHVTLFLSQNISTAEGDVFAVNMETDKTEGKDIVHSTMNGNGSQTVVTDHALNMRVVIPDSESEDCHFLELDEEEKTEPSLEEDTEGVAKTMESAVTENVNATEEKTCLYDEDEPVMSEELKTTITALCGPRKIRHLTRKGECQDIPQDGSQQDDDDNDSEVNSESGLLVRRKRFWGRCPYRCKWFCRRVTICCYRRSCRYFFCTWRRYCYRTTHYYLKCGRFC
ncbi:uncharacterized protein LOC110456194 [Mizuhopecten yessoensis]|uniref:uncharacterized protein LOC110456194 n=1 Tax=Mizuhopecten yessoensis TaxID=6573 RepID=UPI000B4579E8|nr:uncharacterized protein LOC110456194 [Mizuhopecten yessoensis]